MKYHYTKHLYVADEVLESIKQDVTNSCKPTRCIDPVMKYCQECKYGYVHYPEWVETYEDTIGCVFETGCIYHLENTEPTEEEIKEFDEWWKRRHD